MSQLQGSEFKVALAIGKEPKIPVIVRPYSTFSDSGADRIGKELDH